MAKGYPANGINKGWFKKKEPQALSCKQCNGNFFARKPRVYCGSNCLSEGLRSRPTRPAWNKGKPAPWAKSSPTSFKKGMTPWNKGIKCEAVTGANHSNWKGGREAWPKCTSCGTTKYKYRTTTTLCARCFMGQAKGSKALRWKGGINSVIKRRATLAGAEGSHSIEEWELLKKKNNYMCLCCKQQEPFIKLSEDHIKPLSLGGSNDISNIQPLCKSCNSRKHTKAFEIIGEFTPI